MKAILIVCVGLLVTLSIAPPAAAACHPICGTQLEPVSAWVHKQIPGAPHLALAVLAAALLSGIAWVAWTGLQLTRR